MDLGTARDLRLMADEYLADAAQLEQSGRNAQRTEANVQRPEATEENSRQDFGGYDLSPERSSY